MPDFPSPKVMFVTPRWRVDGYVDVSGGAVLVSTHDWISAGTAENAIKYVRKWYCEDSTVRYEATEVTE